MGFGGSRFDADLSMIDAYPISKDNSQRPVQPSFGRPISSLDIKNIVRFCQNALWEDPRPRHGLTKSKFGLSFINHFQAWCDGFLKGMKEIIGCVQVRSGHADQAHTAS